MTLRIFLLIVLTNISGALFASPSSADHSAQSVLHILDYIRVDYANTVVNGQVVDEEEYHEQHELATHLQKLNSDLPVTEHSVRISASIDELIQAINQKASAQDVASQSQALIQILLHNYPVQTVPEQLPDAQLGANLYQHNCQSCHGVQGFGDGPNALSLEPRPANFHDLQRQYERSVFGLYNTITLGVAETAMQGYSQLSDEQRWALAFYVSNMVFTEEQRSQGQMKTEIFPDLQSVTLATPANVLAVHGTEGLNALAYYRTHPPAPETNSNSIDIALEKLAGSVSLYRNKDYEAAYQTAVDAYLLGVEPIEPHLKAVHPELKQQIESAMNRFRADLRSRVALNDIEHQAREIRELLEQAGQITTNSSLSSTAGGFSAFIILLREGLEAILIIGAIAAFMVKTDRRHELHWVHLGWISALLLGILTWFVAANWIDFSASNREMTEGIAAIIAAVMLLYIGYWLHRQSQAKRWQQFISSKLKTDVSGKTAIWSLIAVVFLAVYREMFETILFLQTLWVQVGEDHQGIISGAGLAAFALVLSAWLIFKFSARLPIGIFFRANALLLFILAVVFAGQGIYALQEAGSLPFTPFTFPQIDILGIYPNGQSLMVQTIIILGGVGWILWQRSQQTKNPG